MVLKEDQENSINGKPKDSVREEIVAVSGTTRIRVQNRHQNPFEPPKEKDGRSTSRRKSLRDRSRSEKVAPQQCRDYIEGKCTRQSCNYWHPPECQFYGKESGCKFGEKCSFAHRQVEDQPSKKRMVTKMQWLYCKIHDSWVAYFNTLSPRNLHRYGRAQKSCDQLDECNSQKPRCVTQSSEKAKVHRLE